MKNIPPRPVLGRSHGLSEITRVLPQDWGRREPSKGLRITWGKLNLQDRFYVAVGMLRDSIDVDPEIRSGVPVLKGTRVPISYLLAEIADDQTISEIAEERDLDKEMIVRVLRGLSIWCDMPLAAKATSPSTKIVLEKDASR